MEFLHSVTKEKLISWLSKNGEKPFRAKQILDWLWKEKVQHVDEMTNLGLDFRKKLQENFCIFPLSVVRKEDSEDKETTKYLFRLFDGKVIESVLIRSQDRRTVCVSSQVGCPVGCAFCASGQKGWFRNLDRAEIVAQVLAIDKDLALLGEKVTHVVYMGMGEPLENYDEVTSSIRLLMDPELYGLSQRRITLSTVGVVPKIISLSHEGLKINLALSLHASNQSVREKIIPYARKYPISDILDAVRLFRKETGRDVTFEYILLSGINDKEEHAHELVKLLKKEHGSVNLIPYNPVPNRLLKRPDTESIRKFQRILEDSHIATTCRYRKGDDIAAACGQLALQENFFEDKNV